MAEPKPSFHPSPSTPRLRLPPRACDAHVHVFGPQQRFPFGPDRAYTPADAPKEKLFALHAMLGIERCVVVHTAAHGFDNSASADAIAAKAGQYCGVALARTDVSDAQLRALHAQGFRGVRFNYMPHLGRSAPIDEVITLSHRLAPLGWHLQIHMDSGLIESMAPSLKRSAVPVMVDHMGRVDASRGLDQAPFQHLLTLLQDEKFWVKVSCSERASKQGAPYADAVPFARKLVREFGDRTVWGTDWPHPNCETGVPDDGMLVDLLAQIAPTEAERQRLLVDNPQRFYGFPIALG